MPVNTTQQELLVKVNAQNNTGAAFRGVEADAKKAFGKNSTGGLPTLATGAATAVAAVGTAVLAVGSGLVSASEKSAAFEKDMARVGALSGATKGQFDELKAAALELGNSTAFSASEAAVGMQALAMAGFSVNDTISAMPAVLATASAAQSDLGATADIVSNIMSGFNISADETGTIADVLTATFTSSNTTLESLGETMKYVGPIAVTQGQSLETMAAAAGLLGSAGIQGSEAGTALRASLLRLASPTRAAEALLDKYNITLRDANGEMLPLPDLIGNVQEGMESLNPSEQTDLLKELIGTEAMGGFSVLLQAGPEEIRTYAETLENSLGEAARVAGEQTDTLAGSYAELTSKLDTLAINIGDTITPAIRALVDDGMIPLLDATNSFFETVKENNPGLDLVKDKVVGIEEETGQLTVSFTTNQKALDALKEATTQFTAAAVDSTATVQVLNTGVLDTEKTYSTATPQVEGLTTAINSSARAIADASEETTDLKADVGDLKKTVGEQLTGWEPTIHFKHTLPDGETLIGGFIGKAEEATKKPGAWDGLKAGFSKMFDGVDFGGMFVGAIDDISRGASFREAAVGAGEALGFALGGPLGGAVARAITSGLTRGQTKRAAKGAIGVAFQGGRLDLIDRDMLKQVLDTTDHGQTQALRDQINREFPNATRDQKDALYAVLFAMANGQYSQVAGTPAEALANQALEDELVRRAIADANKASAYSNFDDYIQDVAFGDGGSAPPTQTPPPAQDPPPASPPPPAPPTQTPPPAQDPPPASPPPPAPPPPAPPAPTWSPAAQYLKNNGTTFSKSQLQSLGWSAVGAGITELYEAGDIDLRNIGLQLLTIIRGYHPSVGGEANARSALAGMGYDIVAAQGYHGVLNKPTTILAGEAGPERVDISPMGGTATGGSGHGQTVMHFNINVSTPDTGSMKRWVERDLFPMIQKQMVKQGRAGEGLVPQQAVMAA